MEKARDTESLQKILTIIHYRLIPKSTITIIGSLVTKLISWKRYGVMIYTKEIENYILQYLNAIPLELSDEEITTLQKRIIQNEYLDLLLNEATKHTDYSNLSPTEILMTVPMPILLRKINLPTIHFDISCYQLPDGCLIELDHVSGYFAAFNDQNEWHLKLRQRFGLL